MHASFIKRNVFAAGFLLLVTTVAGCGGGGKQVSAPTAESKTRYSYTAQTAAADPATGYYTSYSEITSITAAPNGDLYAIAVSSDYTNGVTLIRIPNYGRSSPIKLATMPYIWPTDPGNPPSPPTDATMLNAELQKPDIAFCSALNVVYVVDHTGSVQVFDPSGAQVRSFQVTPAYRSTSRSAIAADSRGSLYIAQDTGVSKYNTAGKLAGALPLSPLESGSVYSSVAVDGADRVYIPFTSKSSSAQPLYQVAVFSADGTPLPVRTLRDGIPSYQTFLVSPGGHMYGQGVAPSPIVEWDQQGSVLLKCFYTPHLSTPAIGNLLAVDDQERFYTDIAEVFTTK